MKEYKIDFNNLPTIERELDPDAIDWDCPDEGIPVSSLPDGVIQDTILAAIAASERVNKTHYTAPSKARESTKPIEEVRHVISDESDRAWVESEWPGYHFVWDKATGHHDHPISHLATELNEREMVGDLVRQGKVYIDLFGNPRRNQRHSRKAVTLYSRATPKDYLRYQSLTEATKVFDMDELCDPNTRIGSINDIACTHALYYLNMSDIGRIVNTSAKRRLRAMIHRHSKTKGTLNRGEMTYEVSEDGIVRQENVLTGEYYEHASMEALFHQFSAKTAFGGVAWTVRKAGGDTFFIDFVGCDLGCAETWKSLFKLKPETREVVEVDGIRVSTFLGWTWMKYDTDKRSVSLGDQELFTKLRRYVSGRKRTPQLLAELFQHARRQTSKTDIISIHGGGAHEIPLSELSDYVNAAFYIDVRKELETAIAFSKRNSVMVDALNKYYDNGSTPVDLRATFAALEGVAEVVKDVNVATQSGVRQAKYGVRLLSDSIEEVNRVRSKPVTREITGRLTRPPGEIIHLSSMSW